MARIEQFEDVAAWRKARELTREIYRVTATGAFSRDFSLRDQIRRAAVSAMSNIAEGFERGGDREFIHFLATTKASADEVRSQRYVALDAGLLTEEECERLMASTLETARLISGFMRYLTQSDLKGSKFSVRAKGLRVERQGEL